ncbi:lipocalin-like domain-containing protein [Formosa sediminum]|uniref:Lipocalin-like domain-containing protein n=1 Tax=Formosa sediminum TaxID=2594004 RepID=A0A516GTP5_9FLAO|nr:lipocalin-like domain-containing protein [Formosa sediminum]QDO94904.1 lipocalin-like domain-containing protein [Formosa sediminum]
MKNIKLRDQLVGAWTLKEFTQENENGETSYPLDKDPLGFIMYTPDGYMSAQMQKKDRNLFKSDDMFAGEPEEYKNAASGYLAYSGRFSVNEIKKTVAHELDVSLFPNWLGKQQVRLIKLENNILNLETEQAVMFNGELQTAKVVWERAVENV